MENQQFQQDQPTVEQGAAIGAVVPAKEYLWARVDNSGQRMLIWWPDVSQFRQAVIAGRIPGTVRDNDDVFLGQLEASHMELINSPGEQLMSWSEPVAFIRIGN